VVPPQELGGGVMHPTLFSNFSVFTVLTSPHLQIRDTALGFKQIFIDIFAYRKSERKLALDIKSVRQQDKEQIYKKNVQIVLYIFHTIAVIRSETKAS